MNCTMVSVLREEGVVSRRGPVLGGRQIRALIGGGLTEPDSRHRRQRRPFRCATSPHSSTVAPQSVGCPSPSQSSRLEVIFVDKNAVRMLRPFFGHDFVAKNWALSKFEGEARCVAQILSPFSGHESATIFTRNLWGAEVFFCEARWSFSPVAEAARPRPASDARSVVHAA